MSKKKYPENLLKDISMSKENLPDDIEASILYVLSGFSEREQYCLLRYYRDGLTLEKVACELKVTGERVRQINRNTLRKLAAPQRRLLLETGVKETTRIPKKSAYGKPIDEVTIKELELSIRSNNGLYRSGINTVGDLKKLSKEELYRIRNLGIKSFQEIEEKLNSLGIGLAEEPKDI